MPGTGENISINVGKFLALILRHQPEAVGIELDKNGWADVEELIGGVKKSVPDFNRDELELIVKNDTKQRYSLNEDKTKIRANQGHSVNVDVELHEIQPPAVLYHGTAEKSVDGIMKNGIESRSRLYVHLSKNKETALSVGGRHGRPVIFGVNAEEMYRNGYKFYISENGVYLTKYVPTKYLKR